MEEAVNHVAASANAPHESEIHALRAKAYIGQVQLEINEYLSCQQQRAHKQGDMQRAQYRAHKDHVLVVRTTDTLMEACRAIQSTKNTRNVCGMFHEAHSLMQERLGHIKWQEHAKM